MPLHGETSALLVSSLETKAKQKQIPLNDSKSQITDNCSGVVTLFGWLHWSQLWHWFSITSKQARSKNQKMILGVFSQMQLDKRMSTQELPMSEFGLSLIAKFVNLQVFWTWSRTCLIFAIHTWDKVQPPSTQELDDRLLWKFCEMAFLIQAISQGNRWAKRLKAIACTRDCLFRLPGRASLENVFKYGSVR